MERKDVLTLLAVIIGIFIIKFLWVSTKKIQFGVGNDETWEIARDKNGRLLSIRVKRDLKKI